MIPFSWIFAAFKGIGVGSRIFTEMLQRISFRSGIISSLNNPFFFQLDYKLPWTRDPAPRKRRWETIKRRAGLGLGSLPKDPRVGGSSKSLPRRAHHGASSRAKAHSRACSPAKTASKTRWCTRKSQAKASVPLRAPSLHKPRTSVDIEYTRHKGRRPHHLRWMCSCSSMGGTRARCQVLYSR